MTTIIDTIIMIEPLHCPLLDPDQVILCGSYARGEANEDSDIDLLNAVGAMLAN